VTQRLSLPPALGLAALCTLALAGGGCSYAFVDGPPANHARVPYFECSSSKAWPVADVVLAATLGIGAAGAFADDGAGSGSKDTTEALLMAAEAAVFAVSALSGYQKVADCREAKTELIARLGTGPQYAAAPSFRAPPPDPWVNPPPGLFAPRGAPRPDDEPAATTTETPDIDPVRPLPSPPGPAVDAEVPR